MDAVAGLVTAGAELVVAGAGRWSLLPESGRRCKKVADGAVSKGIRLDFLN